MLANFLGVLPILTPPLCALATKKLKSSCGKIQVNKISRFFKKCQWFFSCINKSLIQYTMGSYKLLRQKKKKSNSTTNMNKTEYSEMQIQTKRKFVKICNSNGNPI
jgi:hypothetical protein